MQKKEYIAPTSMAIQLKAKYTLLDGSFGTQSYSLRYGGYDDGNGEGE